MKIYQIFIFIILIFYIYNKCQIDTGINEPNDCHIRQMSPTEKEGKNKYCCYCNYIESNKDYKECISTTQEEYDQIDTTIKQYEVIFGVKIKIFDCKSSYLEIGFLSLLLFIF